MKLSASNIGWTAQQDPEILKLLQSLGFSGLEIAPTRIFPTNPYDRLGEAAQFAADLKDQYGLSVSSMQSIWYGVTRKIAESAENRRWLLDYTKKAIAFADTVGCTNLVFGCPKNRSVSAPGDEEILAEFLYQCAEAALPYGVVIALEANPTIYGTNYMNTTAQALELLRKLRHPALMLNFDMGTVIQNEETLDWITADCDLIHHVHISEPRLAPIAERPMHAQLKALLEKAGYEGFVSLEMGKQEDKKEPFRSLSYVQELFSR